MRGRLVAIISAAIAIPLALSVLLIVVVGYRSFVHQTGAAYEAVARYIAERQDDLLRDQIADVHTWLNISRVPAAADAVQTNTSSFTPEQARELDLQWPVLSENDARIREILSNPVSRQIHSFQSQNPHFKEILITDTEGRLIAASNKTSDFWQADESWWQSSIRLSPGEVWTEGLHFDQSAKIFSRDICLPLYIDFSPGSTPVGVLKGIINVASLHSSMGRAHALQNADGQIVLLDGRILTAVFGKKPAPLTKQIAPETLARIRSADAGWFVGEDERGEELIGFATIKLEGASHGVERLLNVTPVKVIVREPTLTALAPIRRQLWMLSLIGIACFGAFLLLGVLYANKRLITPINILQQATTAMLERLDVRGIAGGRGQNDALAAHQRAEAAVQKVEAIRTNDELEQLSQGYLVLARRVLNYHEQLENELEERTQEYAIDLKMARDFQQAFLSREMMNSFSLDGTTSLGLRFDHVYRPAFSIGGDFYDISSVSDDRAGIFIADVMGHGLRSALITAVMRTLLQDLSPVGRNSAQMMRMVNQRFYDLMPRSSAQIFATAFYLVADIRQRRIYYSSAGHFSPLIVSRKHKTVEPLIQDVDIQPALGLLRESIYSENSRPLEDNDLIVFFTDGVTEASNIDNEEFGIERLIQIIKDNIEKPPSGVNQAILHALHQHMDTVVSADDICLISVEAVGAD